ncbi:MAG: M20/M25/M40 family metallo-hydrolase [Gemmatimonadetes bacterium]|nr:M20/M25/M40 family metallo-hydrolase [Gemmatimonadota bacterium]MDA1103059.1 M20/M25/M40 family metallo-hydrolase [Gemmatimonadota bacterium]
MPSVRRPAPVLSSLLLVAACGGATERSTQQPDAAIPRAVRIESLLSTLAADSMEGRRTGTIGAHRAARFLAAELERYGVEAAGDDGYFQRVPLARVEVQGRNGPQQRLLLPSADLDFDTLPADRVVSTEANVVGIIRGSDPTVSHEVVVLGAHYDHVGIGAPVDGLTEGTDSIYNGADDDGSGTIAVLEIARQLVEGPAPRRTVVVLLSTGEEMGLLGTRWYIESPVEPLEQTVANLQIEMIGRPDPEAGGFGRGWLTGYERTTMGDQLAAAGSPIVADPRLEQNFFFRSDNIAFARIGIPAHTLSSFNLHSDYHQPSDEVDKVDFAHMSALVEAAIEAVRFLADGPKPEWKPGGMDGLTGN